MRFCDELRKEGVRGRHGRDPRRLPRAAEVHWTEREDFKETLAATLAKSQEDRHLFELLFDRFFFNAVEAEVIDRA